VSLRRRLLFAFAAVAMVLAVADLIIVRTVSSSLYGQIDERLVATAPRFFGPGVGPQLRAGAGTLSGTPTEADASSTAFSELYIAIWDITAGTAQTLPGTALGTDQATPDTRVGVVSPHVPDSIGAASSPFTVDSVDGDDRWRLVIVRNADGFATIAGIPLATTSATSQRLIVLTLAASGAVLVVLGLVGWWVLRLGLRPIDQLVRAADEIAAGDLTRRLAPAPARTEAGHLTKAFNGMVHQIERAFSERQASEDRLRRFVADASHELRTPLTSIRGYTDLMRVGAIDDPPAREDALRRISGESARMAELVEDLLVLARLDQGRPLEREPVDLVGVVTDAVLDARAVAPDRPITLLVPHGPVIVPGDESRLRQVVANLLTNARVHTAAGTPVTVSLGRELNAAEVIVADEGDGMEPDVARRVFERFYRADSSRSRDRGGSGLGLSIVSAVAEAHGGRATVDSARGLGTRFTVELPFS
jgi:two-component system OmpR family sensor kinase